MLKVDLMFNRTTTKVEVPKNIETLYDMGIHSIYQCDMRGHRRLYGHHLVVLVKNKYDLDAWLKDYPEVYAEVQEV